MALLTNSRSEPKFLTAGVLILGIILGAGGALRYAYGIHLDTVVLHHDAACPISRIIADYYDDVTRKGTITRYAYINGRPAVHPGDVVLDCGAWIGDTTYDALKMGAGVVVAIDPSEFAMEQLRHNLAAEISAGRVIVKQVGVLDHQGVFNLYVDLKRQDGDSLLPRSGPSQVVNVTTIDALVEELGLSRVDYIKMDIEGSEQKALVGAAKTIQRFKPRLAIASYHLPDDFEKIPQIVMSIRGDYQIETARCLVARDRVIPNLLHFQ